MKRDLFFANSVRTYTDRYASSQLLRFNQQKSDTTKPTAPGSLTAPVKETTHAVIVWTESTDENLANYAVYCNGEFLFTIAGLQADIWRLIPNATYLFRVTAIDKQGNESDPSPELIVKTPALP